MDYKRISNQKVRRHKKRANEMFEKFDNFQDFTTMDYEHSIHNIRNGQNFETDKKRDSPEPPHLASTDTIHLDHRKHGKSVFKGMGLDNETVSSFCNINNVVNAFTFSDMCVSYNIRNKDMMFLLWLFQYEFVSIAYVKKNYHEHPAYIFNIINKLYHDDLLRKVRIRAGNTNNAVYSGKKIHLTEQAQMICRDFFRHVKIDAYNEFPYINRTRNVTELFKERGVISSFNPINVTRIRKVWDKVYPPACSRKYLKDIMRDSEWSDKLRKDILKKRFTRSAMENLKTKEIYLGNYFTEEELEKGDFDD